MPSESGATLDLFGGKPPSFFPTYKGEERNRTSMLLSLITTIRPFSIEFFAGLTSSTSHRTVVDARIEPTGLTRGPGAPDAIVSLRFGTLPAWRCLIEVKSRGELTSDQVRRYFAAAEEHGLDHVLTISRAIQTSRHPSGFTPNGQQRRPGLSHLSWLEIDNAILRTLGRSEGTHDLSPSSRKLLEDFHSYLRESSVETVSFASLGSAFNRVRQLPIADLRRREHSAVVEASADAWLAVISAEALRLSSRFNQRVIISSPTRNSMAERELSSNGRLMATFKTETESHGRIHAALEIASGRLSLIWSSNLDVTLGPRTRARRRWSTISEILERFPNSATTVSVRGEAREILFSGGLTSAIAHCSASASQSLGTPRSVEIRRSTVIRKMSANTVASRLHNALVSFAPWDG
jgi:hypothetical protein